jgi:hypothetical protein
MRKGRRRRDAQTEWSDLARVWTRLPPRVRDGILVLAGIRQVQPEEDRQARRRARPGETPAWLVTALNVLRDSKGYLSDREVAERTGVAASTLSRHEGYQRAKRTYLESVRPVVRTAPQKRR